MVSMIQPGLLRIGKLEVEQFGSSEASRIRSRLLLSITHGGHVL